MSDGREIHQRLFSKVTAVAGEDTVRIHLEESRVDLPEPKIHDLAVPVTVR